jgi:hypothetical protein
MLPGLHAHQQQILAAIADVEHLRHRQVVEIDRLDPHSTGLLVPDPPDTIFLTQYRNRLAKGLRTVRDDC